MGTSSYVLVGTQQAMERTFGSTCHGAGRAMSRAQSKKTLGYKEVCSQICAFLANYYVGLGNANAALQGMQGWPTSRNINLMFTLKCLQWSCCNVVSC